MPIDIVLRHAAQRLGVGLVTAFALACGGGRAPTSPQKKPAAVDWDGSRSFETANGPMVLAGPVLRSPKRVDTTAITSSAISERCWAIALGIPHLKSPFDETVRGFVRAGSPFDLGWEPRDGGAIGACTDAFGYGFRLPTLAEAQAAFEMRTLTTRAGTSVLVRDDERGIMTVSFEPKSQKGCRTIDPGCDWHVEFETNREKSGLLYCVGAVSRLPAPEPPDHEIRQCVRRASAEVARLDRSRLGQVVPEAELDLVFAMRRACRSQKAADFDALGERLRRSSGNVPLNRRLGELRRALADATNGHATAVAATDHAGGAVPMDCAEPRERYRKICAAESCLAGQVRYATHCLGSDQTAKVERLATDLELRIAELGEAEVHLRTETEVATKLVRCAQNPSASRRFVELLGEPPAALPPSPPCLCPIEELDCGISLLLDPGECPMASPSKRTRGTCGCAAHDLSCAMKCSE
jgi:hypothetical protein